MDRTDRFCLKLLYDLLDLMLPFYLYAQMDQFCLKLLYDPMGLWNRFCRYDQMDR